MSSTKRGAGVLVLAADTGRALFARRSELVHEPGTWAFWGGALEPGETPRRAALRELREESGYDGEVLQMRLLYVYERSAMYRPDFDRSVRAPLEPAFRYSNYAIVVPHEFQPRLNWENDSARWVTLDRIPRPWHFGVEAMFGRDPERSAVLQRIDALLRPRRKKNPAEPTPLYHVTFLKNLEQIAQEGLQPGLGQNFSGFAWHAAEWLFLTDEDGLRTWFGKFHDLAESESDNPVEDGTIPVVLRVSPEAEAELDLEDDAEGNRDVPEGQSFKTQDTISPEELRVWNGHSWEALDDWEAIDPELGVTRVTEDTDDSDNPDELVYVDDASESALFPIWHDAWGPRRAHPR